MAFARTRDSITELFREQRETAPAARAAPRVDIDALFSEDPAAGAPGGGAAGALSPTQARLDALKSKHGNYADNLKAQAAGGGPQPAPRR